jgi:hypothetical protein
MKIRTLGMKRIVPCVLFYAVILMANQIAFSQYVCQINSTTTQSGSIAAGDATQTGRVFRDGTPSSCTGGVPTSAPVAGTYRYDAYNFTNPTGQNVCVTVDLDATACGGTANNSTQINAYSPSFVPTNVMTNLVGKPGFSTIATGSLGFPLAAGASFTIVVHEVVANGGCASYNFKITYRTNCREPGFDRTNDGKADPTLFTPSTGMWSILNSAGGTESKLFGLNGDIVTPGDYTGDGQTDVSTYRPSANTWFYSTSQTAPQSNVTYVPWGVAGDIPVPNDYDKDGKTDVAVWRPSNGFWYVLRSSDSTVQYQPWGTNGDTPVTGDYDGDLAGDFGIVRTVAGQRKWFILNSNFGYGFVYGCPTATPFCGSGIPHGLATDRVVSGDFDGDARTDIAVFRPSDGTWQYLRSSTSVTNAAGTLAGFAWGIATDIPQPADYDGDKRTDFAVFRPSTSTWYLSNSNNGAYDTYSAPVFGAATDQPATSPYLETNP